jgi:hypothetical protein
MARRCLACARLLQLVPQVPDQSYCSSEACQRERRKLWQRDKRQDDSAYQANQAKAQRAWSQRNPDYWKQYREAHPEYAERNRQQQQKRNLERRSGNIAKKNVSPAAPPLASGVYRLSAEGDGLIAKMAAWIVKITLISEA